MFIVEEPRKQEDLRRFPRQQFREAVQFQMKEPQQLGWCLGCDISEGGLRIHFENFVPLNTEMIVWVKLPSGRILGLSGRVVWANQIPHSDYYHLGLKFTENQPSEATKQEFQRYFQSRLF